MRKLPLPQIDHKSLYSSCAKQSRGDLTKRTLLALLDQIVEAGVKYEIAARGHNLFNLPHLSLSSDERKILGDLYKARLVSAGGVGRWAYDQIRNSAKYCPYCTFGEVYEVDHFLAQSAYEELNVCPSNLIPVCHACNHIKLTCLPESRDKYMLHPYFDELPHIRWLFADLVFSAGGPVLKYRVALDPDQYGDLSSRLRYHFSKLQLDRRFQERASTVLVEIESELADNFDLLSSEQFAAHFRDEADRSFRRHGNTLESAGYLAASENAKFCSGQIRN